jgi:hypothetical protein
MSEQPRDAGAIWHQTTIPVVFRRAKGMPLLVKLPYATDNFDWLRNDSQRKPHWNKRYKCWETPYAWLNALVRRLLSRYGRLYLIQPHKVLEICAPACWNATGFECDCSCMGQNHGSQSGAGWYVISESFALRWQERELACRLIEKPNFGRNRS